MNVLGYERGLYWEWSVMNGYLKNVVCNKRVIDECGLKWTGL